jgi:F0F1-type ATP synthase assembly protein I
MKESRGPGLLLIGVGSVMTSMIAAGFILGYLTDSWLNTQPIFLISFGALGLIGGFLKVYRLLSDPELY